MTLFDWLERNSKRLLGLTIPAVILISLTACGDDTPSGPGDFPDVRGTWTGQYSTVDCQQLTGSDPFFCDEVFYIGRSLVLEVTLDQSNGNVSGVAVQGGLAGEVRGTVDMSGVVTLSGELGVNADASTTITDWQTVLMGDSLVGVWAFEVEDNTGSGFGTAAIDTDVTLVDPTVVPTFLDCPPEASVSLTDQVDGTLGPGDCQIEELDQNNDPIGESYFDLFAVDVVAGDQLEVTLFSRDFGPFLMVVDSEERLLGFDGSATDSIASVALEAVEPETWLIAANSTLVGEEGDYSLTTEELSGGVTASGVRLQRVTLESRGRLLGGKSIPAKANSDRESILLQFARPLNGVGRLKAERRD